MPGPHSAGWHPFPSVLPLAVLWTLWEGLTMRKLHRASSGSRPWCESRGVWFALRWRILGEGSYKKGEPATSRCQ